MSNRYWGGWIGVDLDGTLAEYHGFQGPTHIGAPIPMMVERVKRWHAAGVEVRIFTARAMAGGKITDQQVREVKSAIMSWCLEHLGFTLDITACKDFRMIECWDDRAIQIIPNTGRRADGQEGVVNEY